MVSVVFTRSLERHLEVGPKQVNGDTVRGVLETVFVEHPKLRGYLLDDQGALRKHVTVFIDGEKLLDRTGLSDPTPDGCEVCVMQALSGG